MSAKIARVHVLTKLAVSRCLPLPKARTAITRETLFSIFTAPLSVHATKRRKHTGINT